MKKAFSLIEIIFTITIISILLLVAIPKLFFNIDNANIIKLRSDIAIIRNAIITYENQQSLQNKTISLDTLDDNNNKLFSFILDTPIIAKSNESGKWSQSSTSTYQAWITSTVAVNFTYNQDTLKFDCNFNDQYCEELTQ